MASIEAWMVLIAAGLLALAFFVALCEAARRGVTDARVVALVEAGLLVPLAGFGALMSLILWRPLASA
jgi:hypothetical protein